MKGRDGQTLKDIKSCIKHIDFFFPNNEEAAELTGFSDLDDMADCLIEAGVGTVVITRGREGCFIKSKQHRYMIPVPLYEAKMVDTIGAGDNFVAGFITALLDGMSIEQCGQYANAVATISIQSRGATSGVKSRQQVDQFIREHTQIAESEINAIDQRNEGVSEPRLFGG
jgi:sugar/nucleoside kinase (ribokinase family)